jgi:hypothetical protein
VLFRFLSVVVFLLFAFMVAVDVRVLTTDGTIKWGIFIGYLVGTAVLGYLTVWLWRRPKRAAAAAV